MFSELRKEYTRHGLLEHAVDRDPLQQFQLWLDQAVAAGLVEPNAFILATASLEARPSARVVLLKGIEQGLVFFTNYESRKGRELAANPWAAAVFYWPELERQVRVEGAITRISAAESDAYFASRPRGSQLGTLSSPQSQVLSSREELELRHAGLEAAYAEGTIARPQYWGGFRLDPQLFEFWQGRPNRLHDRLRYRWQETEWLIERLAP